MRLSPGRRRGAGRVVNKTVRDGVGVGWASKVLVARALWHGTGLAGCASADLGRLR